MEHMVPCGTRTSRACHFGIKLDPTMDKPSKICFVLLSNPPCISHNCQCEVSQEQHILDWSTAESAAVRRPRFQVHVTIASKIIQPWLQLSKATLTTHSTHHDTPDCNSKLQASSSAEACQSVACFPTEERERQKTRLKQLKLEGKKAKTRPVYVEPHFDDCGNNLTGLANLLANGSTAIKSDPAMSEAINLVEGLDTYWLTGSGMRDNLLCQNEHTYIAGNIEEALNIFQTLDSKVDLVEICGGAARTSTVCIRKQLQVGRNFDLITQCDLNDPSQQQMVIQYFCDHKPLVAVMAPRCSASSSLNHQTHPTGWEETYQNSVPHV